MENIIYKFFYKTKGVISVFLVLVLVPIVTACSLYVDASRIKLAHSVITSSGDLALNTVLSDFDADLAELYGMMASAQNNSQAINAAKTYFKKSMVSQGLDEAYASEFSNIVGGLLEGQSFDTVHDLLGVKTMSVDIKPLGNANLANETLIRQQIIEFMKYRGPIEGVSELWDDFMKIKNSVNDSKKIAKLTKDADDYYENQKDAMENIRDAYCAILNYNDVHNKVVKGQMNWNSGITKSYIDGLKTKLTGKGQGSIYDKYQQYHRYMVFDLATYMAYNSGGKAFQADTILDPNATYRTYYRNTKVKLSINQLEQKLNKLQSAYVKYLRSKKSLETLSNSIPYNGSTYQAQYWIQMQRTLYDNNQPQSFASVFSGRYEKSIANELIEIEESVANFEGDELDQTASLPDIPTINDPYRKKTQSYYDCIQSFSNVIRSQYPNNTYNTITDRLHNICNNNRRRLNDEKSEVNKGVYDISKELNKYIDELKLAESYLSVAASKLKSAKDSIEKMNNSFETWKADYNSSNSRVKNEESVKKQYDAAKEETKKLGLNPDKCQKFINRINNTKSLLGSARGAINGLKYKQKAIKDITSLEWFKSASQINPDKVSTVTSELNSLNSSTFKNAVSFPNVSNCSVTNNNNPDFMSGTVPELYTWMQKHFVDKKNKPKDPRIKDDNQKKNEKKFENKSTEEDNTTSNVDTEGKTNSKNDIARDKHDRPSAGNDTDDGVKVKEKGKNNITNMSSAVGNLFKDFGDSMVELRDDLYLLLYISNMFSYDTFTKEKNYEQKQMEKNNENTDFLRCSLTNQEINEKNNFAFGSEIEYIIYGKTNEENKIASYGTIFAIRYALDLLYALTHFWSGDDPTAILIESLAQTIAAATSGVIPAPLTKLVLILGLTGAEAANDLVILRKGKPLAILKDDNVWAFKLDANFNFAMGNKEKANEDATLKFQYSDYLKLILMMKLIANDGPIVKRVADVIQANMQMRSSSFLMKKAHVYYRLEATCQTPTMMLALPVVKQQLHESKIKITKWNEFKVTLYRGY